MRTDWGRWLVSQRFMRAFYGFTKAVTFPALALLHALLLVWPGTPQAVYLPALRIAVDVLIYATIAINLLRGIPVLLESRRFFVSRKQA
jgi:hypothetical protein